MSANNCSNSYQPADTAWFADCLLGVGVHWTARTAPFDGPALPFAEAVERFDVDRFADAVARAGADYALLTVAHALQMIPAPIAALERVLPGRTCRRDLVGDMAEALGRRGLPLLLYYNHSCNRGEDPEWERAAGYRDGPDLDPFAERILAIVREMGERWGDAARGWWFDSPYSLDDRGPENFVSTELDGWRYPWPEHTRAAKAGFTDRLVAYNAGVGHTFLYTDHQDFWAGEFRGLQRPPTARFVPENGLQWHEYIALDQRRWVHDQPGEPLPPPRFTEDELVAFLARARRHRAPVTFNVAITQDGTMPTASLDRLRSAGERA